MHTEITSAYGLDLEKQTKKDDNHPIYRFDPAKEILLQMVEESMSALGDIVFSISGGSVMIFLFDIALSTRPQSRRLDICRILLGYHIPRVPGMSLRESIAWLLIPDISVESIGTVGQFDWSKTISFVSIPPTLDSSVSYYSLTRRL